MKSIIISLITKLFPKKLQNLIANNYLNKNNLLVAPCYIDDFNRIKKYGVISNKNSKENLITLIISYYHSIEKGFSMPDFRIGFGQETVKNLITTLEKYKSIINDSNPQYHEGIAIVYEYINFHFKKNYQFSDDFKDKLKGFISKFDRVNESNILSFNRDEYFQSNSDFYSFAYSRHSLRNYDEKLEVSIETINKALQLCETTPTGCNRQPIKVFVISDRKMIKEVLSLQNGNSGFGHLANKLIIVGSSYSKTVNYTERNQIIVDGGIYTMNLLYSLHYYQIGACTLNCNLTVENANRLRTVLDVNNDLQFISMVSLGHPPKSFKTPKSLRDSFATYTSYY